MARNSRRHEDDLYQSALKKFKKKDIIIIKGIKEISTIETNKFKKKFRVNEEK